MINPAMLTGNFNVRFNNAPFAVTVQFEAPVTSWHVRSWLFLNHFGVFESYLTTGRAKTSVTRPEHTAARYMPELDKFYDIDLGSKPVETISLPSGLTNAAGMRLLRHFALSDCIFLPSASSTVASYIIKQSDRIIADDMFEPSSSDMVLTRSMRNHLAPTYRSPEAPANNLISGIYNLISGQYNLIGKCLERTPVVLDFDTQYFK
jgi:hypothetical protein